MEKLMKRFAVNNLPKKKSAFIPHCTQTFGLPLCDIVERDKTEIPVVVLDIFDFLLKHDGFEAEGIFRVNGNSRTIEALRRSMDEHGFEWRVSDLSTICSDSERTIDVYSVASLLKLYVRELPGGLVSADQTSSFIKAYASYADDKTNALLQLEKLLSCLPTPNYVLLQRLCQFLSKILCYRAANKMSSEALGIVFGPNVFRVNQNGENIQDQNVVNRIMSVLIDNQHHLFHGPPYSSKSACLPKSIPASSEPVNGSMRYADSASSGTDSISHSTTLNDADNRLALFPIHTPSTKSCSPKPADFSAGLAMAIRICVEEHLFGLCSNTVGGQSTGVVQTDEHRYSGDGNRRSPVSDNLQMLSPVNRRESFYENQFDISDSQITATNGSAALHPVSKGPSQPGSTTDLDHSRSSDQQLGELTQRLHDLKAHLRDYEREFEGAWGHRPSALEKRSDLKMSELMDDLSKIRSQIKVIRRNMHIGVSQDQSDQPKPNSFSIPSQWDHAGPASDQLGSVYKKPSSCTMITERGEPVYVADVGLSKPSYSAQRYATEEDVQHADHDDKRIMDPDLKPYAADPGGASFSGDVRPSSSLRGHAEPPTGPPFAKSASLSRAPDSSLSETFAVLLHRLAEKRFSANRPEALNEMTPKQIEEEKLALQKALLYFENLHGRPKGHQERMVMRPLYDRYRNVKRLLSSIQQPSESAHGLSPAQTDEGLGDCRVSSTELNVCVVEDLEANPPYTEFNPNGFPIHNKVTNQFDLGHQNVDSSKRQQTLPNIDSKKASGLNLQRPWCTDSRMSRLANPSATLPATSQWSKRRSSIPPEPALIDSHHPSSFAEPKTEWFGSFRVGANQATSSLDIQQTHTAIFPSSATHANGFDSCERRITATSPIRPKSATMSRAPDPSAPQTLIHNRRVLTHSVEQHPLCKSITVADSRSPTKSAMSELSIVQLEMELRNVRESKRQLQKTLKDFEHEVQKATGHKVDRSDRMCMRTEYNQYKVLKTRLLQLESELALRTG